MRKSNYTLHRGLWSHADKLQPKSLTYRKHQNTGMCFIWNERTIKSHYFHPSDQYQVLQWVIKTKARQKKKAPHFRFSQSFIRRLNTCILLIETTQGEDGKEFAGAKCQLVSLLHSAVTFAKPCPHPAHRPPEAAAAVPPQRRRARIGCGCRQSAIGPAPPPATAAAPASLSAFCLQ